MQEREQILKKTNNGYDIFAHYLGERVSKKVFCNPFRADTAPSCRLKERQRNGSSIWTMVDYGDSDWCGDVFTIIAKCLHINPFTDFRQLLSIIDKDMDLFVMQDAPADYHPQPRKVIVPPAESKPVSFSMKMQAFRQNELRYWDRYGITQAILDRYHVKSLRSCSFVRDDNTSYTYRSSFMEPMYGYLFNNNTGIKCYRPFSSTRFLYAGNLPRPYVFGWDQLQESGEYIIITGGEKDVMSLASRGFSAIALNSESAHADAGMMQQLQERFKVILFMYDADTTGKREMAKRIEDFQGQYHVHQLLLPLAGTKEEKDISDFFRKGHTAADLQGLIDNVIKMK